ncbi:MAG: cytochrome c oxidase assembly protein [Rhizobiaceae bacterium]
MQTAPNRSYAITATICVGIVFGMVGMAYAAVPLYKLFCQVTGYAGTTQRADDTTGEVLARTITVRFDANISPELEWKFKPKKRAITLRIGEKGQAFYEATNLGKTASFGTATFNVSPQVAGVYFNKIECFCFTEQKLEAGETVDMPVVFFVDPDIVNDPLLKNTTTITLSYTFFPDEEENNKLSKAEPLKTDGEKLKSSL